MSEIKLVEQGDTKGCAAACIAMVTGKTFEQVQKDFRVNFNEEGITTQQMAKYLGWAGFSVFLKSVEYFNEIDVFRKEMLKPFAPVHILSVKNYFDSECKHAIVMDAKGKIFNPMGAKAIPIDDVYSIDEVIGLYK